MGILDAPSYSRTQSDAIFGPIVPPPDGFALPSLPMPTIRRLGGGRFTTTIDAIIDSLRPPAGVTYYAAPTGSAGADGLTPATATTITTALTKTDIGTLILAPGEYFRGPHATTVLTRDLCVIGSGPGVRVTGWTTPTDLTWTLYSGAIYQTTRSATTAVADTTVPTDWGDYAVYTQKTTPADITAPGQWALVGSTLYVWALNNANLANTTTRQNIRVAISAHTGFEVANTTLYAENIQIEAPPDNGSGILLRGSGTVLARNCSFKYAAGNAYSALGGRTILQRCLATSNFRDGFNYHVSSGGIQPEFIEVDCVSHHNGLLDTNNNNATTSHDDARGIRVGGQYAYCQGPTVVDVGTSKTWNLGCTAKAPAVATKSCWQASEGTQWLDECSAIASATTLALMADTGGTLNLHRTPQPGDSYADRINNTATIAYY